MLWLTANEKTTPTVVVVDQIAVHRAHILPAIQALRPSDCYVPRVCTAIVLDPQAGFASSTLLFSPSATQGRGFEARWGSWARYIPLRVDGRDGTGTGTGEVFQMINGPRRTRSWMGREGLLLALLLILVSAPFSAAAADRDDATSTALENAAADDVSESRESRRLEPRYHPREPEEKSWYNASYVFGMTRSLANSTISPAGKAPLFVLTVPLDIVFLPFALIGGLFG